MNASLLRGRLQVRILPGSPFAFLKALGLAAVLETHEPTS